MMIIKLNTAQMNDIKGHLRNGGKIEAIKALRETGRHTIINPPPGSPTTTSSIGLREAKDAVEAYILEHKGDYPDLASNLVPNGAPSAKMVHNNPIKRIIVDCGAGEVEVDMEGMSLQFLSGMKKISLDELGRLIDLWKRVKAWEDGE